MTFDKQVVNQEMNMLVGMAEKMVAEYTKIFFKKDSQFEKIQALVSQIKNDASYETIDSEMRLRAIIAKLERAFVAEFEAQSKKNKKLSFQEVVNLINANPYQYIYLAMVASILRLYYEQDGTYQLGGRYRVAIEAFEYAPGFAPIINVSDKAPMHTLKKVLQTPDKKNALIRVKPVSTFDPNEEFNRVVNEIHHLCEEIQRDYSTFTRNVAEIKQFAKETENEKDPEDVLDDIIEKLDATMESCMQQVEIDKIIATLEGLDIPTDATEVTAQPAHATISQNDTGLETITTAPVATVIPADMPVKLSSQEKHDFLIEIGKIVGTEKIDYVDSNNATNYLAIEKTEAYWKNKAKFGIPTGIKKIGEILHTTESEDIKIEHILAVVNGRLNTQLHFFETRDQATEDFYKQIKHILESKNQSVAFQAFRHNDQGREYSYAGKKKQSIVNFSKNKEKEGLQKTAGH